MANLFDTGKDEVGLRCIWMRAASKTSGRESKLRVTC